VFIGITLQRERCGQPAFCDPGLRTLSLRESVRIVGLPGICRSATEAGTPKRLGPVEGRGQAIVKKSQDCTQTHLKAHLKIRPAYRAIPHRKEESTATARSTHRANASARLEALPELAVPQCSGHDAMGCHGALARRLDVPATRSIFVPPGCASEDSLVAYLRPAHRVRKR
jgi:hypothetical protein